MTDEEAEMTGPNNCKNPECPWDHYDTGATHCCSMSCVGMMTERIKNMKAYSTVFVTGASGGIGGAICDDLSSLYADVVRLGRDDWAHAVVSGEGDLVIAHGTDDKETCIDVNCSGIAYALKCRFNAGLMRRSKTILIASRQALRPSFAEYEYAMSKAAIHAACTALYAEGANITSICPGWVDTNFQRSLRGTNRAIQPDVIARLIRYILTSEVRIPYVLLEPDNQQSYDTGKD